MRYHPFDFDQFVEGPAEALTSGEGTIDLETFYSLDEVNILPPLLQSPYLTNLRVSKLGFSDSGDRMGHSTMIATFNDCNAQEVIELMQKCPRLEELYLNTNLSGIDSLFALPKLDKIRVLHYYYGMSYGKSNPVSPYPLTALAMAFNVHSVAALPSSVVV